MCPIFKPYAIPTWANNALSSTLAEHTYQITQRFLSDMGDIECTGIYQQIIAEAEIGMLKAVLEHTQGNQTNAAKLLGITRTTLRQRIERHQLR